MASGRVLEGLTRSPRPRDSESRELPTGSGALRSTSFPGPTPPEDFRPPAVKAPETMAPERIGASPASRSILRSAVGPPEAVSSLSFRSQPREVPDTSCLNRLVAARLPGSVPVNPAWGPCGQAGSGLTGENSRNIAAIPRIKESPRRASGPVPRPMPGSPG